MEEKNPTIEELKEEIVILKAELKGKEEAEKARYVTDSVLQVCMDRVKDREEKAAVRHKWEVTEDETDERGLCGNIKAIFVGSRARLVDMMEYSSVLYRNNSLTPAYTQISSALALYRTISLFECGLNANKVDFYKLNWTVNLKHKKTGLVLGLGEWKGGFQIFTTFHAAPINAEFQCDAEELLNLLVSPTLTISYDGTVAGTVA